MLNIRRTSIAITSVAMDLSNLEDRVLNLCESIPSGMVTSYGDIAAVAGCGPRQVGRIIASRGFLAPWWRVVRADGSSAVADRALELWDKEGIPHDGTRVKISECRFNFERDNDHEI